MKTRSQIAGEISAKAKEAQALLDGVREKKEGEGFEDIQKVKALNDENRQANMTTVKLNAAYFPSVEMLSGVAIAGIVLYGGYQAIDGSITTGTVVAFVAAVFVAFWVARVIRQVLQKDVLPAMSLPRGVGNSISVAPHPNPPRKGSALKALSL